MTVLLTACLVGRQVNISAQTIPTGISTDSIHIKEILETYPYNTLMFYYYKPVSYDPLTSPLLFAIHGDGDNGLGSISVLENIAERRKALVIAPDVGAGEFYPNVPEYNFSDSRVPPNPFFGCEGNGPMSEVFKKVYQHILLRENRTTMPSYLIGFSAGGQFVTRYMLLRQAYPDSIPLQMACSKQCVFLHISYRYV